MEIKIGEFLEWTLKIGKWNIVLHGDILIYSWIVMAIIVVLAWLATRGMSIDHPTRRQTIMESIIEFLRNALMDSASPRTMQAFAVPTTLFLFILVSNLIGLIPIPGVDTSLAHHRLHFIKSPTEDISFTLAMGLVVFLSMIYYGLKVNGFNYIKGFFKPFFLFFPIHLIDIAVKPVTLAFRLFGNIFSGAIFILVLYNLLPPLAPIVALGLGVFVGCIQAYLFFMLSTAYISSAIEEGGEHDEGQSHAAAEH
jgi:F-type H+-transporting ATPase subunit a